jgi:DNA-binding MarR family transcriptional regulator
MARPPTAVQEEIRQTRPFSSPSEEGVVALARTADQMKRALARVIEPHAITVQQYNVLRILRGAGGNGLPTLEIAGRMVERAPGVTRLLDRLEAKALVRRERSPRDRRQILCWITPAGLGVLDELDGPVRDSARAFMAPLKGRELPTFIRLLDELRAGSTDAGPSDSDDGP